MQYDILAPSTSPASMDFDEKISDFYLYSVMKYLLFSNLFLISSTLQCTVQTKLFYLIPRWRENRQKEMNKNTM